MNNLNTIDLDSLYMQIHDRLDTAFPEFEFKPTGSGWKSGNVTKLDGREGKTPGQVICTDRKPTLLADHSDGAYLTYWDYIQKRDNLDNGQTFKKLAELAGIELPKKALTKEQLEERRRKAKAAHIWELFADYCKDQLLHNTDADLKAYLTQQRKYTMQDVEAMELGQLTDWTQAMRHIKDHSQYTDDTINEVIQCKRNVIGWSHKLIIPIRNTVGQIEGIIARNVNWTKEDTLAKYFNSTGLKKGSLLYGLPYRPKAGHVVLVEGQLDAAIARAREYKTGSVAALGGKAITEDQVRCLLATNTKAVTICLDNEAGTKADISRTIELLQKLDEEEQIGDRIYIAALPEGIKDADELITKEGLEAFEQVIANAFSFQRYQAQDLIDQHDAANDRGINDLIDGIVAIASTIKSPARKDDLLGLFGELLKDRGIIVGEDAMDQAADRVKAQRDQQEQDRQFKQLLKDATKKAEDGETIDAIDHIEKKLRQVKQRSKKAEYDSLYSNVLTEDNVYRLLHQRPKGAKLGLDMVIEGDRVSLEAPAGQLTFFAAPTNHGKTGILLNIAVNILQEQPERSVHYFTFEMDAVSVLKFALNIYQGKDLSQNNRRSINGFFDDRTTEYISQGMREGFQAKKDQFFSLVAEKKLNIHYQDYSADELIGFIEYIKKQDREAVIIVDYIQKLRSDKKGDISNRQTELKFICEDLNACAITTQLPIILAAQFNRSVQTPLDMHPTLMAEASDIEKIASEIYGLWNCRKKMQGKPDSTVIKTIEARYGMKCDGTEQAMILEILKSRQYASGFHAKLNYHTNSGRLDQLHTTQQSLEGVRTKAKFG